MRLKNVVATKVVVDRIASTLLLSCSIASIVVLVKIFNSSYNENRSRAAETSVFWLWLGIGCSVFLYIIPDYLCRKPDGLEDEGTPSTMGPDDEQQEEKNDVTDQTGVVVANIGEREERQKDGRQRALYSPDAPLRNGIFGSIWFTLCLLQAFGYSDYFTFSDSNAIHIPNQNFYTGIFLIMFVGWIVFAVAVMWTFCWRHCCRKSGGPPSLQSRRGCEGARLVPTIISWGCASGFAFKDYFLPCAGCFTSVLVAFLVVLGLAALILQAFVYFLIDWNIITMIRQLCMNRVRQGPSRERTAMDEEVITS